MPIQIDHLRYSYRLMRHSQKCDLYMCQHSTPSSGKSPHFVTEDQDLAIEYTDAMNNHRWDAAYRILNGIINRPNLPPWGAWETCVSKAGFKIHTALEGKLAAAAVPPTPQLNVQYDVYDPTTVTFESTDDGHGGWHVRCVQSPNTIYWWGGAFMCDDLACYLNHGHFAEAHQLMTDNDGGITQHGWALCRNLTTLINRAQAETDTLADPFDDTDTWGIGNKPHGKVKAWEPDTPDPDVDLMKSIRDACAR